MRFLAFAASVAALAFAVSCGGEDESSPEARSTIPPTVEATPPTATVPAQAPAILKVYFLRDGKVAVSSRSVVAGPAVARAALNELFEGPNPPERARGLSSAIPGGTTIVSLDVDRGTAAVELSSELDVEATAQVVYTLTQFGTVERVSIGAEVMGRSELEDLTPAILVESPLPGADVSSPLRIEGTANTFEATFHVEVVDARGRVLGEHVITATSGSGQRGTFSANVTFAALPGPATLVAYELSAEDGSRLHEVVVPLQITS
jgi:immunoglobulin-like protein involved in spore germination/sporulation and spore germination protein